MLDFLLVLGQIPGTNFQITFYELIAGIILVLIYALRYRMLRLAISQKKRSINYLRQKSWQRKQLSLPV